MKKHPFTAAFIMLTIVITSLFMLIGPEVWIDQNLPRVAGLMLYAAWVLSGVGMFLAKPPKAKQQEYEIKYYKGTHHVNTFVVKTKNAHLN